MVSLCRPYPSKFFKGSLPQILLGPFLNTLPHILLEKDEFCNSKSITTATLKTVDDTTTIRSRTKIRDKTNAFNDLKE